MNVSPGDIAIIVKGRWPNVGRLVYVAKAIGLVDYHHIGYGDLESWWVETLGAALDSTTGPVAAGHTPDLSLKRLGFSRNDASEVRRAKARLDFDAALNDLARIFERMPELEEVERRQRQAGLIKS